MTYYIHLDGAMRPGQSELGRQQRREIRGVQDRGDSVLEPAKASEVSTGDQGGEHAPVEVRRSGDSVAGHIIIIILHLGMQS